MSRNTISTNGKSVAIRYRLCSRRVVSSYECHLCVTFPIKPLMLRCPSSAAVQLWPLLLRKGPAPPPELGAGPAQPLLVVDYNRGFVTAQDKRVAKGSARKAPASPTRYH